MQNEEFKLKVGSMTLSQYKKELKDKIFKLLPLKEKNKEWKSYLQSLVIEMQGAQVTIINSSWFLSIINQIKGLETVEDDILFRKTILSCLAVIDKMYEHY